jgi:hypothetical protein
MKSLFKSFLFVGIFALVFLNVYTPNTSAATSNNCSASYTASGVSFTLAGNPPLPANSPIDIEVASSEQNVGASSIDVNLLYNNGGFQGSTNVLSSPDSVYYRFILDGQQYCPPTGVKSLTASTTTTPGAGGGSQTCPAGQTWNPALGICAPTAQTVGADPTPGIISDPTPGATPDPTPGIISDPTPEGTESISNPRLINPLGGVDSIEGFLEKLFNIVLRIAIPIIALAIIYSGFLFVTAQGKEDKLTTAKNTLMYTLIGAAIILGAWVIANALSETVNDIREDVGLHSIKDIA